MDTTVWIHNWIDDEVKCVRHYLAFVLIVIEFPLHCCRKHNFRFCWKCPVRTFFGHFCKTYSDQSAHGLFDCSRSTSMASNRSLVPATHSDLDCGTDCQFGCLCIQHFLITSSLCTHISLNFEATCLQVNQNSHQWQTEQVVADHRHLRHFTQSQLQSVSKPPFIQSLFIIGFRPCYCKLLKKAPALSNVRKWAVSQSPYGKFGNYIRCNISLWVHNHMLNITYIKSPPPPPPPPPPPNTHTLRSFLIRNG